MSLRKRLLCLLLCLVLTPLALPNAAAAEDAAPLVRVLLRRLNLTDRADLQLDGVYTAATANGTSISFARGSKVIVQIRDDQLYLFYGGMSMSAGKTVRFTRHASPTQATDGIRFETGGNYYPGHLALTVENGMLSPVLSISVEDYLLGVVPYEMSDSFPLEALKAQAVCARTYALSHVNAKAAWDVVDTTNDQVFKGVDRRQVNAIRAVEETAGIVGMYKGQLANCYYSASNGGQTELVENVWSGRGDWDYYAMVDDPYDLANPESIVRRSTLRKNASKLPDAFRTVVCNYLATTMTRLGFEPDPEHFRIDSLIAASLSGQPLGGESRMVDQLNLTLTWSGKKRIHPYTEDDEEFSLTDVLTAAGASVAPTATLMPLTPVTPQPEPQIVLSEYIAAPGEYELTIPLFPELIRALGLSISGANNELVTLTETEDAFILESRRYGHGVGMSQRGAQWMAGQHNMAFHEILAFYYPGMSLAVAPHGEQTLTTPSPDLANTPGPSATPTPRPTLMPVTQPLPEGAWLASVEYIEDDSSLNLRAEPSLSCEIIMRLYKHQRLIVLEVCEDPEWVHVRTDVTEGYVKVSFLEQAP